ncbi:MAG: molybdate ABC transporter substrate-binding protein [Anaerolineae bacterium]|jgi:molybdate transport system substrate-binding protein|nr:molybdate ABC transporter substrate-binding protein [Anaerolineae bacterium]
MRINRWLPWLMLLILGSSQAQAQPITLTVFAAASLTDAFEEIGAQFESEHPEIDVIFNFAGSSALSTQILEGAPADVFASANQTQMQEVQEAGLVIGEPRTFAKNRLVLIVPSDNPANIQGLRDLANEGVKLVVAAPGVPVREYTDTLFTRLAVNASYGETYYTAVIANIVSEEDNVRQVAAKVALGEADAGIVYQSDVTPDLGETVIALPIPDALNTIATYPIAPISEQTAAPTFIDYVLSENGQATLVKWGFISAVMPDPPDGITLNTDGRLYIDGQVLNPLALSVADLQESFNVQSITLNDTQTTVIGVRLFDLLSAAQVHVDHDVVNDRLSLFVVGTNIHGEQLTLSWGEIDPEFGDQTIYVISDGDSFQLVSLSDRRSLSHLVQLTVRDAPRPKFNA